MNTKLTILVFTNTLLLISFLPTLKFEHFIVIISLMVFNLGYLFINKEQKEIKSDKKSETQEYEEKIRLEKLKNEYTNVLIQQGDIQHKLEKTKIKPIQDERKVRF